jgi:small membrane protein
MIRVILLGALIAIGAFITFGRNTAVLRAGRKLIFLAILLSGCVAVLFPDLVSDLANLVGVGRGTDLLLYVMTITVLSLTLTSYIDKKRTERREATLAQAIAILEAQVQELRTQMVGEGWAKATSDEAGGKGP